MSSQHPVPGACQHLSWCLSGKVSPAGRGGERPCRGRLLKLAYLPPASVPAGLLGGAEPAVWPCCCPLQMAPQPGLRGAVARPSLPQPLWLPRLETPGATRGAGTPPSCLPCRLQPLPQGPPAPQRLQALWCPPSCAHSQAPRRVAAWRPRLCLCVSCRRWVQLQVGAAARVGAHRAATACHPGPRVSRWVPRAAPPPPTMQRPAPSSRAPGCRPPLWCSLGGRCWPDEVSLGRGLRACAPRVWPVAWPCRAWLWGLGASGELSLAAAQDLFLLWLCLLSPPPVQPLVLAFLPGAWWERELPACP